MAKDAAKPRGAGRKLVIALVVLALLALVGAVTCCGGGWYWLQSQLPALQQSGERAVGEAEAFAASHAQSECEPEGLRRMDGCGEALLCAMEAAVFTRACLDRAAPTPGICDGVPPPTAIVDAAAWANRRCAELGRERDPRCPQLIRTLIDHCAGSPR